VAPKDTTHILEADNGVLRGSHINPGDIDMSSARPVGSLSSYVTQALLFDPSFSKTGISPPPPPPVTAQAHLECAREVLDRKRKLAEKTQNKANRMNRKRKIHDEGAEIRKCVDRPAKRQCDEKTRNVGLFAEIDMEVVRTSHELFCLRFDMVT